MIHAKGLRRFVIGGTLSSLVAIVAVKALGLLESIAVARIIGGVSFGILALVLSATNLVMAAGTLGLPSAVTKFISGESSFSRESARGTLLLGLRFVIANTLVAGILSIGIIFWFAPSYVSQGIFPLFLIGVACVAITAPLTLFVSALQGFGSIGALNMRNVLGAAIGLGLAIGLSFALGAAGALLAFAGGSAITAVLSAPAVLRHLRGLPSVPRAKSIGLRSLLNYGLPSLFSGTLVLVGLFLVNSLLVSGGSYDELGAFSVAFVLANLITLVPGALSVPLFPILSSLSVTDPARGRTIVPRAMRFVLFLSTPIVVAFIAFGPEVIELTYGAGFSRGAATLGILAVSALITAVSGTIGNQIAGTGRMWLGLVINSIWTVSVTSAALVLIPAYAGVGAGLSILLGYIALAIASVVIGRTRLGLRFAEVAPPALWAGGLVTAAGIIATLGDGGRLLLGPMILMFGVATAYTILNVSERKLLKDLGGRIWSELLGR